MTRLSLRVIKQNSELNDDHFIQQLHASHLRTSAEATNLVHTGALKKEAVAKEVHAAGAQGGASIVISGKDHDDNKLETTNEGLSPKVRLDEVPTGAKESARVFIDHFDRLTKSGVLKIAKPVATIKKRIDAAVEAWKKAK